MVGSIPKTLKFVRNTDRVIAQGAKSALFPMCALMASGLLLLAIADTGARFDLPWADALFWIGLVVIYAPSAVLVALPTTSRSERIGLVLALGIALYLVKILHSPVMFTLHDEFAHMRNTTNILELHHLFNLNPLQPAKAYFPGLEVVTAGLELLSKQSLFQSALVIVGIGRVIQTIALFLIWERTSGSSRVAAIASVIYMGHPNYLFWSAQFAYESLALPLALFALYAAISQGRLSDRNRLGRSAIVLGAIAAVVPTHHMTSYAFVLLLLALVIIARNIAPSRRKASGYGRLAVYASVLTVFWLVFAANTADQTAFYLLPVLEKAFRDLATLLSGNGAMRPLFQSATGQSSPLIDQVIGMGSVIAILLGLPVGLWEVWRKHRSNAELVAIAGLTFLYPVTLAMRATHFGAETAQRSSEFLFVGVAPVLAMVVLKIWPGSKWQTWLSLSFGAWISLVFIGGILIGVAPWALMPWPHDPNLLASDTRGIQSQSLMMAEWARTNINSAGGIIADKTNFLLLGSIGRQRVVTGLSWLYFSPRLGQAEFDALSNNEVEYVVVDNAMSFGLPRLGAYFESGEPNAFSHTKPISATLLLKFDQSAFFDRIYDDGRLVIYEFLVPGHNRAMSSSGN